MRLRALLRTVLALLLIVIGLFALLTPFTPGSWLALIGLLMLGVPLPRRVRERLSSFHVRRRLHDGPADVDPAERRDAVRPLDRPR